VISNAPRRRNGAVQLPRAAADVDFFLVDEESAARD
jgi:hypothetical protein